MIEVIVHNLTIPLLAVDSQEEYNLKLVLIGNSTVGKTTLRRRYMGEGFKNSYLPTIGADFALKQVNIDNVILNYVIWDVAGNQTFSKIHPSYYNNAFAVFIVYDVTNRKSFEDVENWLQKALSFTNRNVYINVLGNKTDLVDYMKVSVEESEERMKELSEKYSVDINLYHTSALLGTRVDQTFADTGRAFIEFYEKMMSEERQPRAEASEIVPSAYLMTFNDIVGPIIAASSPQKESHGKVTLKAAIGLMSYLEFVDTEIITCANIPWPEPKGSLEYIIYPSSDSKTRGLGTTFIIGAVIDSAYTEVSARKRQFIEGVLHSSLNRIANYLVESGVAFTSEVFDYSTSHLDERKIIADILEQLRTKVASIIDPSKMS